MSNYSIDPASVRVDFFKKTGKWYATEAITWVVLGTWEKPDFIFKEFKLSLREYLGDKYQSMTAVCLEPYHPHTHPLLIRDWSD